jgi:hypothetical protein
MPIRRFKRNQEFSKEWSPLYDKEFEVVPHTASAAEITKTQPISQHKLISGHILTGNFLHI